MALDRSLDFLQYNQWANSQLLKACAKCSPGQWVQPLPGSFPTIRDLWLHIHDAQYLWFQRLQGRSFSAFPSHSMSETERTRAPEYVLDSSQAFLDHFADVRSDFWDTTVVYTNTKGDLFTQTTGEIVQHVCNHSTYHRGQIVQGLRTFFPGDKVPATDYIWYCRKRGNNSGT
jgi:uncharacterized damage-inducible protein DinB